MYATRILTIAAGLVAAALMGSAGAQEKGSKVDTRVFEMRTYYAHPGKMNALHERFRKHTCKLFEKHGMTLVGFWSPTDAKEAEKKMVYILAFPSREAAKKSWDGFRNDPDWKAAKDASEKDGPLVMRVVSEFLNPTDYSPVK
jgi:NIPSNAP